MVLRVGVGKFFSIVHCLQEGQVGVEGFFKTLLRQVFLFQPFYKVVLKVDSGKQNDDEVAVFDVALSVGDLGYFFTTLKSEGVEKLEDVNSATIKEARVRFATGKDLEAKVKTAEFKKVSGPKVAP